MSLNLYLFAFRETEREDLQAASESSGLIDKLQNRVQLLEQQLRSSAAKPRRQRQLRWRQEKAALQREARALSGRAAAADSVEESGVLSAGQLKRLATHKRLRWNAKDMANALGLQCVSRKAYGYDTADPRERP